jgi:hypothetical protein
VLSLRTGAEARALAVGQQYFHQVQ